MKLWNGAQSDYKSSMKNSYIIATKHKNFVNLFFHNNKYYLGFHKYWILSWFP